MKMFILSCLACGLAPVLYAQQTAEATPRPVPPSGPLLDKAPDFAQWVVTVKVSAKPLIAPPGEASQVTPTPSPTPAPDDKPAASAEEKIVVIKTKPLRFELENTSDGNKITTWYLTDMQVTTSSAGGAPVVAFAGSARATSYGRSDFMGFDWISPKNFEGIQKVAGQECLVFRDGLRVEGKVIKSERPLTSVACIALDSRLPVALQLGDELRTYKFGATPTAMLTVPPEVEALAGQWRQTVRRASLPAAKP